MDPLGYSLPVLDYTVRLAKHFNLNLMEIHSVQIACQVLPNSYVFYGIACQMLLQLHPSKVPKNYRRGYGFGFLIARIAVDAFETFRETDGLQPRRFNSYDDPVVPLRSEWEKQCHRTTVYCLHIWAAHACPTSSKKKMELYQKISHKLSEMWKGVGVLGISHSVHQKALLGLLPPWCRELAIVEPSSRVIKFFNTRYDLKRKLKGLELDRFFKTWSARFEHLFGYPFSKRYLENVLCKAY